MLQIIPIDNWSIFFYFVFVVRFCKRMTKTRFHEQIK